MDAREILNRAFLNLEQSNCTNPGVKLFWSMDRATMPWIESLPSYFQEIQCISTAGWPGEPLIVLARVAEGGREGRRALNSSQGWAAEAQRMQGLAASISGQWMGWTDLTSYELIFGVLFVAGWTKRPSRSFLPIGANDDASWIGPGSSLGTKECSTIFTPPTGGCSPCPPAPWVEGLGDCKGDELSLSGL